MSIRDDDRPSDDGVHQAEPRRKNRRRTQVAAGAAGLAALVGAGALFVSTRDDDSTVARNTAAQAPASPAAASVSATSAAGEPGATAMAVEPTGSAAATATAAATPSVAASVAEQIKTAREAAAKAGHPVQRAKTAAPGVVAAATGEIKRRSETIAGGSLRVITAKFDLTGQEELLWAADRGKPVGKARCTQNFQLSNNTKPAVRPNLLLCWRTSDAKSVATILIHPGGKPSTAKSVEVIDREWAKLG